jgi:hypothetical protein
MTAFKPEQSPPLVNTPIRFISLGLDGVDIAGTFSAAKRNVEDAAYHTVVGSAVFRRAETLYISSKFF